MPYLPIRRLMAYTTLLAVLGFGFSPVAAAGPCVNGSADGFPCNQVDFLSHIPLDGFSSKPGRNNDIWGIDKLTYRHGLALPDRGLNAQYIDASAHCEVIFKSKHARKSHIPVTELVNLSIPWRLALLGT
jgi:hypothetical protein